MPSPTAQSSRTQSRREPADNTVRTDTSRPLTWRGWVVIGICIAAANVALIHLALRGAAPVTVQGARFEDNFDRTTGIGPNYFTSGMHWQIANGQLWAPEARNNALWLKMRLPRDVAIEFDARSETASGDRSGDIKFEVFGDGRNHASGYLCVFGGWGNHLSIIGRLDEHGSDRVERSDHNVDIGRTYHMRVERKGNELRWFIDGMLFLSYVDAQPLEGKGHDRFGFSGWKADLFFDNLKIEPL